MDVSKLAHHDCDDGNSPISQSVPNVQGLQGSTSHTANSSQPAAIQPIPTPLENEPQTGPKRKPGSGRPKGSKSTIAPEDRPRRLGRPPGTGHLQRAKALADTTLSRPLAAVSDNSESRPFNLVC
jgi:hypothetical protein